MLLAHKIRLAPTNTQRTFFAQCVGTARFAYNWALDEWVRNHRDVLEGQTGPLRVGHT